MSQSGNASSLKMRCPSLNRLINRFTCVRYIFSIQQRLDGAVATNDVKRQETVVNRETMFSTCDPALSEAQTDKATYGYRTKTDTLTDRNVYLVRALLVRTWQVFVCRESGTRRLEEDQGRVNVLHHPTLTFLIFGLN